MVKKLQALKAKKGFTLVELIVVIAIIGVLAAILVPTMMNVVTKARVSSSDQTAKSLADSVTQWLSDLEANRGTINDGAVKIVYNAPASGATEGTVTVTFHALTSTKTAAATETANHYKRNGSDDGSLAKSLLSDDIKTNYPFKGGETTVVFIENKHVVGCAYSDDGSADLTALTTTAFTTGKCKWDSSSREGITPKNNIVGTNPKLLHDDSGVELDA